MSVYIIGDNTGGKYIVGEAGAKTEDTLVEPTRFLRPNEHSMGMKLFHERGAVYSYVKKVDTENKYLLAGTRHTKNAWWPSRVTGAGSTTERSCTAA